MNAFCLPKCSAFEDVVMVKIIIKSWDEVYKETVRDVKAGKVQKEKKIIYIDSLDDLRSLITSGRLKMLSAVRKEKPGSLYALAKLMKKDIKTIATDANMLSNAGLMRLEKYKVGKRKKVRPIVSAKKIDLELPL